MIKMKIRGKEIEKLEKYRCRDKKCLHLRRLIDTDVSYLFYIFPVFISLKKIVLLSIERNFQVHISQQGWVRVFKPKVTWHQFVFRYLLLKWSFVSRLCFIQRRC